MDTNQVVFGGILTVAAMVLLAFTVRTCGEYQIKNLEVQKACLAAGRTPMECGVVRVVN